jgi:hypothetical protein
MTTSIDPIRITPRLLPRRWGRAGAPSWCANALRPEAPVGEIWIAHAHNMTDRGEHFGVLLRADPKAMLGELGRAPPNLRVVITDEPSDPIHVDAPLGVWGLLESPLDGMLTLARGEERQTLRCRRGDLVRVADAGQIIWGPGITALEARAAFSPRNGSSDRPVRKLLAAREAGQRAVWLRDPALSVEAWTLPELSYLEPDGETCHVVMALTPGVSIDGAPLSRGEAVFLPAEGRPVTVTGRGGQVVVAYPDLVPTSIWKRPQPPKPAALAIDPALVRNRHIDAGEAVFAPRAAA